MAKTAKFTNTEILNTVRENASENYKAMVPVANGTNENAIRDILTDDGNIPSYNEFCDVIVNKFFRTFIRQSVADTRLARFNRGRIPYGFTIEELFVNQAKNSGGVTRVRDFNGQGGSTTFFERDAADIRAMYFEMNRSKQYDTYFNRTMLKAAFDNNGGLAEFIGAISNSIIVGNDQDEYEYSKQLLSDYAGTDEIDGYKVYTVPDFIHHIYTADADIKKATNEFISKLRGVALDMTFNSTEFNKAGVNTKLDFNNMVLFLHKDVAKYVDVYTLAAAFNMDKVQFIGDTIYLDTFGTNPLLANCEAILCDKDLLNVWDNERIMTNQFFPNDLCETMWYTVRQTGYCLPVCNAACFIGDVTNYTVTYKDGDTTLHTYTVPENSKTPVEPTPTKEGYTFKGWSPEVASKVTQNATYSAQWEQDT